MTKREAKLRELLVVLVIVFVLWMLLIPQLGKAREISRRVDCLAHLKQLGLAAAMYAETNQGRCPTDSKAPTLVGSWQLLSNYMGSATILICPSDRRGFRAAEPLDVLTAKNISYSYVPSMIWPPAESDSALALDRIDATTKGSQWPASGNHGPRPLWELDFTGVRGGNVLFCDGHVEFHKTLPSDLKDKDGRLRVLSPRL